MRSYLRQFLVLAAILVVVVGTTLLVPRLAMHINLDRQLLGACYRGEAQQVSRLIAAGADVNTRHDHDKGPEIGLSGYTVLHLAAERGHVDVVHELIKSGAEIDARRNDRHTPLLAGVTADYQPGQEEIVAALLAAGADVSARDEYGYTPLHWAAKVGWRHKAIVALLLAAGADINAANDLGITPLHGAAEPMKPMVDGRWLGEQEHCEVLRMLLNAGADVNAQTKFGETPLDMVRENDPREILEILRAAAEQHQTGDDAR